MPQIIHEAYVRALEAREAANRAYMDSLSITRLDNHAYSIDYSAASYDQEQCIAYFRSRFAPVGRCTSIQNGMIRGRNLDWNYADQCVFVIRTAATGNRHASIGVAGNASALTESAVSSRSYSDIYRILPYYTTDGINDAGLCVNINVTPPDDYEPTTGTVAPGAPDYFPMSCVPRHLLDYAGTVDEAVALLSSLNLAAIHTDWLSEEFHFMVSDATGRTVIIEFDENRMHVLEHDSDLGYNLNIMTNFNMMHRWELHAQGIERYRLALDNYDSTSTVPGMLAMMKRLWYTNTYRIPPTDPGFWWTEYNSTDTGCSFDDIGNVEKYIGMYERQHARLMAGGRNPILWFTVHTAVYDCALKRLYFVPQEIEREPIVFEL